VVVTLSALGATLVPAAGLAGATAAPPAPTDPTATVPAPAPPTTLPVETTTTTTLPPIPAWVVNPACARVVQPGDSISLIADQVANGATTGSLLDENGFGSRHVIHPGDVLDICAGNGVNDLNGASRLRPPTTVIGGTDPAAVMAQQTKLNELLAPYGMPALAVDGKSGKLTRQQLCAARVLLGLPISRSDMAAGSDEEARLMAMTAVPIPPGAPMVGDRWALIDIGCQVAFFGDRSGVRFVFPTSTGVAGIDTNIVSEAWAFRFDPALDNGGWHDSSEFPAAYDNPLNGNMYKPIYFSNGQAIHGANNVPPQPASHGCVRLRVGDQDQLVSWLGLDGASGPVWAEGQIDLVVTTQGAFLPET